MIITKLTMSLSRSPPLIIFLLCIFQFQDLFDNNRGREEPSQIVPPGQSMSQSSPYPLGSPIEILSDSLHLYAILQSRDGVENLISQVESINLDDDLINKRITGCLPHSCSLSINRSFVSTRISIYFDALSNVVLFIYYTLLQHFLGCC